MSGPTYNQPAQPTYGEGMADALKAQVGLLTGTGDFAGTGTLESLLPLEESVRKKTAQTDTDVLRQTLLGQTTGGTEQEVTYDDEGRIITGMSNAGDYKLVLDAYDNQGNPIEMSDDTASLVGIAQHVGSSNNIFLEYKLLNPAGETVTSAKQQVGGLSGQASDSTVLNKFEEVADSLLEELKTENESDDTITSVLNQFAEQKDILEFGTDFHDGARSGNFKGIDGTVAAEGTPIYAKDDKGEIITEPDKAGTTEIRTLPVQRTGDGLVDLLGSTQRTADGRIPGFDADGTTFRGLSALAEDLQQGNLSRQREADLADVERLSQRYQDVMADYAPGTQEALTGARNILDAQQANLTGAGAITTPTGTTFADSLTGQTMDAATVANTPSLIAQTSFDAATVGDRDALTADTSYDALDQITGPTLGADTTYTAFGARAPDALTADTSFDPSASVTGGTFDRGTTYQASQVADPLSLSAATSFDPSASVAGQSFEAARAADPMALTASTSYSPSASMTGTSFDAALAGDPMALTAATSYDPSASVTGRGYTATAGLDAGQIGADPLRQALMGQAMTAVDQGLTDREIAQIENAARARSTLSGRTFDQQSAIQEAQAVIAEDNARRMQNRGFAQGVLGQEADLQQSDLARGLQAQMQNQAALNQAAQFGASQDMQAQLANQAATNQARQAGITAGLSQEALAAQQRQAQEFANQASRNRAGEFAATTAMEAQRANQAATNQALQAGLQAGLQQESLAAQQAQAVALADQAAQNRASEFGASSAMEAARANQAAINQARSQGLEAGLAQEALAASQAQTKAMADAQAANRAAEFGVSAGLEQQTQANQAALQAQLANQQAQNQAAQFGVTAGLQQEQLGAQLAQNKALADAQAVNRAREFGVQAGIGQEQTQAQLAQQAALANLGAEQQRQESGLQAGLAQEQLGAQLDQQRALADAQNLQQARAMGLTAGLEQDALRAQLGQAQNLAQAELDQQANAFGAQSAQQAALANQAQQQQANQFQVGAQMDAERLNEQLKQSGTLGYIDAATRLAALEDQATLDPFQALLGRGGGQSLQAGQGVLGQANYGLQSAPQYLNPEAGLGFISQMAANDANIAAAQAAASGSAMGGLFGGLGAIGGGLLSNTSLFCWVAREVYGPTNPAWLQFREWMFNESPQWFFNLYRKYGERFASWISNKPRLKGIIRKWMDSKIGDK